MDDEMKTFYSLDFKNDSESSGRTAKPNNGMGEERRVLANKRKASNNRESPRKRQRGASEPTEVAVEAVATKGTKRKSSTERGSASKKQRGGSNNTVEPTKVSVTDVRERSKKEAGAETPRTGCDFSLSSSADFEAKYLQLDKLGEGGFGSVYAGNRKTDNLPVAIKRIPKEDVESRPTVLNGKTYMVPTEVLLMLRVAGGPESVGKSAAVSLLDWYDLDQEVILVMERPVPSVDLLTYLDNNGGPLEEDQAQNIMKQLIKAAIKMHSEGVFHRDIKTENVLVETGADVPRVRVIDFGCGCFAKKTPYRCFSGTSAYAPPEFFIQGSYEAGPTTVWQLGALLCELLDGHKQFTTSSFLRSKFQFNSKLRALKVSQDCQDLLKSCLAVNPKVRATLEQMQLHPWFTQCRKPPTPQTNTSHRPLGWARS